MYRPIALWPLDRMNRSRSAQSGSLRADAQRRGSRAPPGGPSPTAGHRRGPPRVCATVSMTSRRPRRASLSRSALPTPGDRAGAATHQATAMPASSALEVLAVGARGRRGVGRRVLLDDVPAVVADALERPDDLGDPGDALTERREDVVLERLAEAPALGLRLREDLAADVLGVDVLHPVGVPRQHVDRVAAAEREVADVEAPAHERRVRLVEQAGRLGRGLDVRARRGCGTPAPCRTARGAGRAR